MHDNILQEKYNRVMFQTAPGWSRRALLKGVRVSVGPK